jgi:NAD(P)-dependent dehydrogenase (short-subunit alcohol dehydrogenase family)
MTDALTGRAAIITGASRGLGLAIARAYVQAGAHVMLCARDASVLAHARDEVRSLARCGQIVEAQCADVTSEADVTRLVDTAISRFGQVHTLVNNAGVLGPIGAVDDVDWDEWVRAMAININGSVLPIRAVLPHFRQHGYGKIVQLSGGGATAPMSRLTAYAASKAAVVRLAESVAMGVKAQGIDINSVAPGALNTRMMDELLAAGATTAGEQYYARMQKIAEAGGTPLETGAALAVFLGSAASDGITGKLISAVWDPWERLQEFRRDLDSSDIYTLRRVVPKDRGRGWGDR